MTLPVTPEISQALRDIAKDYVIMKCRYQSALREVRTKLEILDDEFQMRHSRNPIHHMESRIKSPQSIAQKLKRKGLPITPQAAMDNLNDIAGIRVVCAYLNDTYAIGELLTGQDDIRLIQTRDYIASPKPNGVFERREAHFARGGTDPHHRHGLLGQPGTPAALQGNRARSRRA